MMKTRPHVQNDVHLSACLSASSNSQKIYIALLLDKTNNPHHMIAYERQEFSNQQ